MVQDFYKENLEFLNHYFQRPSNYPFMPFQDIIHSRLEAFLPKKYGILKGRVINLTSKSQAETGLIIYAHHLYKTPYPKDQVPYLPIEASQAFLEIVDRINDQTLVVNLRKLRSKQILNLDNDKKLHIIYCQYSDLSLASLKVHLEAIERPLSPLFHMDALVIHNKGILLRDKTGHFIIIESTDALTLFYIFLIRELGKTQTREVDRLAYVDQGKVAKTIMGEPLYTDGGKYKKRGKPTTQFGLPSHLFMDYYNQDLTQKDWEDFIQSLEKHWRHPATNFSSNFLNYFYRNFSLNKQRPEPKDLQALYNLYLSLNPLDL